MERDITVTCPRCEAPVGSYCRPVNGEPWEFNGITASPMADIHIDRADQARVDYILKRLEAATPEQEQVMLERIAAGLSIEKM